jgi:hypothetical protein
MKYRGYRKRLAALKQKFSTDPVTLYFADGSKHEIHGRGDFVRRLVEACLRGDKTREVELIAKSVYSTEPGDSHMLDIARVFLYGPLGTPEEEKAEFVAQMQRQYRGEEWTVRPEDRSE